tara:strand:+ start:291 stop:494 length:204 start_codon:yes stop_codon:yes gene_type:complete
MIVHNKGNSIGYDTVNRCFSRVRTVENTSYKTMFNICIDKILEGVEIEKYKKILLDMAKELDKQETQ